MGVLSWDGAELGAVRERRWTRVNQTRTEITAHPPEASPFFESALLIRSAEPRLPDASSQWIARSPRETLNLAGAPSASRGGSAA